MNCKPNADGIFTCKIDTVFSVAWDEQKCTAFKEFGFAVSKFYPRVPL